MRFFWQPRPHECEWRSRLAVACAELDRQGREGSQYVLIARMIKLLDPQNAMVAPQPPPDPRADPLFGTLPVTAPPPEDSGGAGQPGG